MKPKSEAQIRAAEELRRRWQDPTSRERMMKGQEKGGPKRRREPADVRAEQLRKDFIAKYGKLPNEDTRLWLEFMTEREVGK